MQILIEKGRDLLRKGAAGLSTIARLGRFSPGETLPVTSPRICRAVLEFSPSRTSAAIASWRSPLASRPLGYCVRARIVEPRMPAGARDADAMTATRFDVVHADPKLLAFLGRDAADFHVFELRCAGLETLWRGDLARVQETRRPVLAGMTIYAGAEAIEIEHLAFPVLESGRLLEIRGWLDEAYGNPVPSIDWGRVRHVRRSQRSRTVTLPRQLTRSVADSGTSELSVLYSEDPGIRTRFGRGPADAAALEARRRLPRGA